MVDSITQTLGSGSGINITELVGSLVDAQYAVKQDTLTKRSEALTAQISGISSLKSGISGFASALATLVGGGSLATQPTSSNEALVKVSKLAGGDVGTLNSTIEVRQLATMQSASSAPIADRNAAVGKGTLTLTFGTATVANGAMTDFIAGGGTAVDIVIDDSNSSLDGIAKAINSANAGVTASILSDSAGARLVLKGATGASQAFTLSAAAPGGGATGLSALAVGVGASGTEIGSAAQDAIVAIDGVALKRASNSINNLIDGVKIDLVSAQPGTTITLGSSAPTANLRQAVTDVVTTYNELLAMVKEQTNSITGPLRSDPAAQAMLRSMRALTLTELIPAGAAGAPTNLAEIGVTTNRDGTLSVDSTRLSNVLANHPGSVEAMFAAGTGASENGLSAALNAISVQVTSKQFGFGASETRYTNAQSLLSDQQLKASDAAEIMRARLTQQFASMDAKVAAYQSTQTFLEQQIDAWNNQN